MKNLFKKSLRIKIDVPGDGTGRQVAAPLACAATLRFACCARSWGDKDTPRLAGIMLTLPASVAFRLASAGRL